jgi:putative hydrolase of the HAD superfamily
MKTLLLDADGVTLRKLGYFSEHFAREQSIPLDQMTPFYKKEFRLCQTGKADLKEEVTKYLPKWGWDKGADAFLDYWFSTDAKADEQVLEVVQGLRNQGVKVYLATDQEKYRAQYLLDTLDFKNKLDGSFFSCNLGYQKSEPEYFQKIMQELGVSAADLVYWDDDQKNVDVAKSLGIDARFYSDFAEFKAAPL